LLADAIHRFGYDVVRGSSSRLGASAILQLTEVLASGRDVVITPDGPRGRLTNLVRGLFSSPEIRCRSVADESGILALLATGKLGRVHCARPFSKVRVLVGRLHRVGATNTSEEFEAERLGLQNAMMSLVEMR